MATLFVAALALAFFLSGSQFFQIISFILFFLTASGVYACLKGEEWKLEVKESYFSWSYPRWPRSKGTIDLRDVKKVIINDASGRLEFRMRDDSTQRIRMGGGIYQLNAYLQANFPTIEVVLIES
jgi:hypothetical protein